MSTSEHHEFEGVHVLGEMYGIESSLLDDAKLLEEALREGIIDSGATLCSIEIKKFEPQGVTILALLSESHASIHTYPDYGAVFFDAFTCGKRCQPQTIADSLAKALKPKHQEVNTVLRGMTDERKKML